MRRAVVIGMVVVGLTLTTINSATACRFLHSVCGRCYVPCNATVCCVPVRCAPVRCCVPACCVPACCQPVQCQPSCCGPAASPTKAAPRTAPADQKPTPAPPKPIKAVVAPKPAPKVKEMAKPAEPKKAAKSKELTLPALPEASAPKAPATKAKKALKSPESEIQPVKNPTSLPNEKPLLAQFDNPFILETDQLQIWTDSTGTYRVEARFVSFDNKTVRLQRSNGTYVRVAYDRLSKADRERVHDLSYAIAMKMSMK